MAFFDPTPFCYYYGYKLPGVTITAGDATCGRGFHLAAPCEIWGVRFFNSIPGGPTMRAGLWKGHGGSAVEQTDQRIEISNCPTGIITVGFPEPYIADWADLADQVAGTQGYQIGIWDTSGTYYQDNNGSARSVIRTNDYGPIGQCYYGWVNQGRKNTGGGWGAPDDAVTGFQAIDPMVLPTDDSYEPRHFAQLYGSRHSGISTGTSSKTIGQRFVIKEAGSKCYGVEFYTHDSGSWTAKCSLWAPDASQLATATVNCTGQGVYQAMFSAPLTITDAHMARQLTGGNEQFSVGVYNQTNTNYTYTTTTPLVIPIDYLSMWLSHHMNETPSAYSAGDARPTLLSGTEIYPVSPIIGRT
jgi:hypothetical protein